MRAGKSFVTSGPQRKKKEQNPRCVKCGKVKTARTVNGWEFCTDCVPGLQLVKVVR